MSLAQAELPTRSIPDFAEVRPRQVALAGGCPDVASIRDFGGLWLVHGKYALEAAVQSGARFVSMVDLTPQPEFRKEIERARASIPDLEVEFVVTDFRQHQLYDILLAVDASLLYNVLLHQENYMSIIKGVCRTTKRYVCVAQPCLKEKYFSLPASAAIIQFWPDSLKERYREGAYWPKEPESDRFNIAYWTWAHTVSHLISAFHGCGWQLDAGEVITDALGPHWDYPLMRFRPA